jgi:hypothetical protein
MILESRVPGHVQYKIWGIQRWVLCPFPNGPNLPLGLPLKRRRIQTFARRAVKRLQASEDLVFLLLSQTLIYLSFFLLSIFLMGISDRKSHRFSFSEGIGGRCFKPEFLIVRLKWNPWLVMTFANHSCRVRDSCRCAYSVTRRDPWTVHMSWAY